MDRGNVVLYGNRMSYPIDAQITWIIIIIIIITIIIITVIVVIIIIMLIIITITTTIIITIITIICIKTCMNRAWPSNCALDNLLPCKIFWFLMHCPRWMQQEQLEWKGILKNVILYVFNCSTFIQPSIRPSIDPSTNSCTWCWKGFMEVLEWTGKRIFFQWPHYLDDLDKLISFSAADTGASCEGKQKLQKTCFSIDNLRPHT